MQQLLLETEHPCLDVRNLAAAAAAAQQLHFQRNKRRTALGPCAHSTHVQTGVVTDQPP
jgi:hypothetical protein